MSRARFLWIALAACVVLAGGVSLVASSDPDGLDRVAADQGFDSRERAADGPLAGYQAPGVANPRLSTGVAGVIGVVAVLTTTTGLTFLLRRRRSADN